MNDLQTFWQGFRFGIPLQLAVGPVSIFIFQTAATQGFLVAEASTIGVALVDGAYIFAAVSGVGALLARNGRLRSILQRGGALILLFYGCIIIWEAFQRGETRALVPPAADMNIAFVQAIVLTLASPLTIIFWMGVLSAEFAGKSNAHASITPFGAGAVCSTLLFLTLFAAAGSTAQFLLSPFWMRGLHFAAGFLLIVLGLAKLRKKL